MHTRQIVTTILNELNVPWWDEGTNVSIDSVNIQCPFQDCGDHSNHMGIFDDSMLFSCWKCKRKGHFSFLLTVITGKSMEECTDMIDEISGAKDKEGAERISEASAGWAGRTEKETQLATTSPLPKYFEKINADINYPLLRKYLQRRNLSVEHVVENGCGVCRVGKYMNRMIIPIHQNGQQVSFAAADMTGQARTSYLYPGMSINSYLYGYDDIENLLIITEGILDKWRVGKEAVAMFGLYLTDIQKSLILKLNLDCLVFCLDGDAYWHSRKEASFFNPYVERVEVIKIPFTEDPDSLGTKEIWHKIHDKLFPGAA
jgi:DNA primase